MNAVDDGVTAIEGILATAVRDQQVQPSSRLPVSPGEAGSEGLFGLVVGGLIGGLLTASSVPGSWSGGAGIGSAAGMVLLPLTTPARRLFWYGFRCWWISRWAKNGRIDSSRRMALEVVTKQRLLFGEEDNTLELLGLKETVLPEVGPGGVAADGTAPGILGLKSREQTAAQLPDYRKAMISPPHLPAGGSASDHERPLNAAKATLPPSRGPSSP